MTGNHRDDSHLDAAIDRAVRDIMRAEPRAGLRERVLAELTGQPARAAWWPRLAFGSAAVAVAIFVLLTIVNRPPERPVDQTIAHATPPAAVQATTREPAPVPREAPARVEEPRTRAVPRRAAVEDRPVQAASLETGDAIGVTPMTPVEQLRPIEPIRVATLGATDVSTSPISIKPITIERIEITPLSPPSPQR